MPFDDPTANYGWDLPVQDADDDTWGDGDPEGLDAILTAIDADTKAVDDEAAALATDIGSLSGRVQALESGQFLPVYAQLEMVGDFPSIPAATPTALDFTTSVVVDTQEMFATGQPTRLTVPDGSDGDLSMNGVFNLAGLYRLRAAVQMPFHAGSDNGRSVAISIRKNGTDTIATFRRPSLNDGADANNSGSVTVEVETVDEGAVDDYYEVLVEQDAPSLGTAPSATVEGATFTAYRLPSPRFAISRIAYMAGLDVHGNDQGSAEDFQRYATANELDWNAATGKFGGGAMDSDPSASGWTFFPLDTALTGGKIAWYGKIAFDSGTETNGFLRIMLDSALQFSLYYRKDEDDLRLLDSSGTVLATADVTAIAGSPATPGPFFHFEIEWTQSTADAGLLKVYIDGVAVIEVSDLDTPDATWDTLVLRGPTTGFLAGGDWLRRDDIVIQEPIAQLLGDGHRIWTASPDGNGAENSASVFGGPATSLLAVQETDPDQHGSYFKFRPGDGHVEGDREEFTFTLPAITGTIRDVAVKFLASSTASSFRVGLRAGGMEDLTLIATGGNWLEYAAYVPGHPAGSRWTAAALEDAVIVFEWADDSQNSSDITQVWLEVLTTA